MRRFRCFAAALMLLSGPQAGFAADAPETVLAAWYAALARADRDGLMELLTEDAVIRLEDIDVEQDRAAFIASMDEWEDAVAGASLRHRIEEEGETGVTAIVCYGFPDNELMTRERFTITEGKVSGSTQETIAEDCASF